MQAYQSLDWDSNFFGFKVAKITEEISGEDQLADLLKSAKSDFIKLLYWPATTRPQNITNMEIRKLGGSLVDKQITYVIDLSLINPNKNSLSSIKNIIPYNSVMPVAELIALAIQSGEYSRFAVDKNIPREKYEELYTKWIQSSLNKELAHEILVIQDNNHIAGMVTLGEKNGKGDIGLLAVDKAYRGKKLGESLVRASHNWFIDKGYLWGQVITQGDNKAARGLYEKCGYSIEKIEYYYHFWL